jgi:predicted metal-dependent RNase
MNENNITIKEETQEELCNITNKTCNVGDFILPAITSGLISEVIMVNTENKLTTYSIPTIPYLLDIDVDFWDSKM